MPAGGGKAGGGEGGFLSVEVFITLYGAVLPGLAVPRLPPSGWQSFRPLDRPPPAASPFKYDGNSLSTPFYRVRFDKSGRIVSLVDTASGREFVAPGGAFNRIQSADDVPVLWEAWDIDADWTKYIREETRLDSSEQISAGAVCLVLRQKYRIGRRSTLVQDTVFYAENRRIDFNSKIDWREQRTLLKSAFDTAIDAPQVRCEVQYGHLLRNTHRNLPQDRARFEICAHKWISLEENGAGIALLNDCKYGHDVSPGGGGTRMRITLLRSPTAPDEEADQGEQRFTYSLLPFAGPFAQSGVVRAGYELNAPPRAEGLDGPPSFSLFSLSAEAVIAECVKYPEEEGKGPGPGKTLVIRLYESLGGSAKTVLRFNRDIAAVRSAGMLEQNPRPIPFKAKEIPLAFHSFEIKTLLIELK